MTEQVDSLLCAAKKLEGIQETFEESPNLDNEVLSEAAEAIDNYKEALKGGYDHHENPKEVGNAKATKVGRVVNEKIGGFESMTPQELRAYEEVGKAVNIAYDAANT